jgi:hypothetical protein
MGRQLADAENELSTRQEKLTSTLAERQNNALHWEKNMDLFGVNYIKTLFVTVGGAQ